MKTLFFTFLLSIPCAASAAEAKNSDLADFFNENAAAIEQVAGGRPESKPAIQEKPAAAPVAEEVYKRPDGHRMLLEIRAAVKPSANQEKKIAALIGEWVSDFDSLIMGYEKTKKKKREDEMRSKLTEMEALNGRMRDAIRVFLDYEQRQAYDEMLPASGSPPPAEAKAPASGGPVESSIRGVQNILVYNSDEKSPVPLEEYLSTRHQPSWTGEKGRSYIEVKFEAFIYRGPGKAEPSDLSWRIMKSSGAYCVQPRSISSFMALRGDKGTRRDPVLIGNLCGRRCGPKAMDYPGELRPDLPCFRMEKKDGEHYLVNFDAAAHITDPAEAAAYKAVLRERRKWAGREQKALDATAKYQGLIWLHREMKRDAALIFELKPACLQSQEAPWVYIVSFRFVPKKNWKQVMAPSLGLSPDQLQDAEETTMGQFEVDFKKNDIGAYGGDYWANSLLAAAR